MRAITLRGVEKSFGGELAVAGLDLLIEAAEFFAFLGPSGSGKTTVLRMIAGLAHPDSGAITIGTQETAELSADARNVAMVGVEAGLIPNRDARYNLAFPLLVAGTESDEIDERVAGISERMRLFRQLDRRPAQLSEGERQNVSLGRALVREVDVVLFDEPLAKLDARARERALHDLRRLRDERATTIVYVTNDQAEAMSLADRVGVLDAGRLQQIGAPADVYENPASIFVAGFLGSPPMNLVRAWVTTEAERTILEVGSRRLPLPDLTAVRLMPYADEEVIMGVRPEDLHAGAVPESAAGVSLGGVVDLVEFTGSHRLIHFSNDAAPIDGSGPARFTARLGSDANVSRGDRVAFGVAAERLRFFDPHSGSAI